MIERVLAIPPKRFDRRLVTFLTEAELDALLAAPARSTWTGRRDHALLGLAAQTGLRASELIGLRRADVHLGAGAHVSCLGKGRKLRITPLTSGIVAVMRGWLAERAGQTEEPVFPTQTGKVLSRDALEHRLAKYVEIAAHTCPSVGQKTVTMHVLRHTAAMRLLRAGIDTSVIALWLGHEQIETTQIYLHADLEIKEREEPRKANGLLPRVVILLDRNYNGEKRYEEEQAEKKKNAANRLRKKTKKRAPKLANPPQQSTRDSQPDATPTQGEGSHQ